MPALAMKLNIIVNISSASRNKKLLSTQPFSDYGKVIATL